ncbi:MAG: redoxin domain-containing protein [Bacteroidetes bacterium]|nr:redoxin domain-containing protein [Bacteroidota bacterium]MBK9046340.1 redoxin domain-containing protein [Bacteroidota bacterium]
MTLQKGQQAPDFTLYNTLKQPVQLSSLKGAKVVLLFFPAAFTGTCTKELCSVRDDLSWYNNVNVKVFGISTDAVFSLIRYKAEQNLNFELLSDFNKTVCEAYGSQYDTFILDMKGVAKRSAFVIDETGVVVYAEVLDSAGDIPDFEKIKAALN